MIKKYAVVKKWRNASDFQVLEYFENIVDASEWIRTLPKSLNEFSYEIMKYI